MLIRLRKEIRSLGCLSKKTMDVLATNAKKYWFSDDGMEMMRRLRLSFWKPAGIFDGPHSGRFLGEIVGLGGQAMGKVLGV
jgi:hypothetical protein